MAHVWYMLQWKFELLICSTHHVLW